MDSDRLDKAIVELESNSKKIKGFAEVYSEISKLQADISLNLKLLTENNASLAEISSTTKISLETNEKQLTVIKDYLEERIEELYKDNKSFQKELDSTMLSRLDKHNSDIQVVIRNEGIQIQRAFEAALQTNFISLESKLKESFDKQKKQFDIVKILLFVFLGIEAGLVTLWLLQN